MDDTFVSILMTETVDRVCQSNGKHSPPELINVVFSLVKDNNQSKVHPLSLFTKLGGWGGAEQKCLIHILTKGF